MATGSAVATRAIDRRRADPAADPIRVAIVGATGYVGGELIRILDAHPYARIVGLVGRGRDVEPIGATHAHLANIAYTVDATMPEADAVFLALPHGAAASLVPEIVKDDVAVIDLGPDFRLRDPADYPRWYGFDHPAPDLLARAVYGLPELYRAELAALATARVAIVGSPGCYPTATLLALAPLARAGLIDDVVVDAKSGVSGAGREAKADLMFSEVNESVRAYGIGGHRHVAEMEQELAALAPEPIAPVDFAWPLTDVPAAELAKMLTMMPQSLALLDATIEQNLLFGRVAGGPAKVSGEDEAILSRRAWPRVPAEGAGHAAAGWRATGDA